ncbi:MAG: DUF362 domain-containing protein, partial [Bryobacteraceae bacterium]
MRKMISRRYFLDTAIGAGLAARAAAQDRTVLEQVVPNNLQPAVSIAHGDERRRIVCESLTAIDDQIRPVLKRKKYVVIKPNMVSTENQLAATHAGALHGILDYLEPRFKGPVIIAEASAGDTLNGFENFKYQQVVNEHRGRKVSLLDLNRDGRYQTIPLIDYDWHVTPVRLAAHLLDPDAYVICAAVMKTHNVTVATMSVKNMTLGAPLRSVPKQGPNWNDKRKYHNGVRGTHYNMFLTAQKMKPFWGATVIDGFEGMEGNGPASGTPVASRIAIASTDYIAADRVGVECMGINPDWLGYLQYCSQCGIGQYDLAKISVRGAKIAGVMKKYRLHRDIERELLWMG